MKEKSDELNLPDSQAGKKEEKTLQGYPIYPDEDDIYVNFLEEEDINQEDTAKTNQIKPTMSKILAHSIINHQLADSGFHLTIKK